MRYVKWLAVLPFVGMLGGPFAFDRVEPFVLGLPALLAWLVGCVIATTAIMALVYLADPANRSAR